MVVDQVASLQRFCETKALIKIDHQMHFVTDGLTHRLECREVIRCTLATEPQLEPVEAAFVLQLQRLLGHGFRLPQPKAVAVVGFYWPDRAAEQHAEREV